MSRRLSLLSGITHWLYSIPVDSLLAQLREHQFPALFIDGLGWDRAHGSATFQVRDHTLDFRVIAQKRGVQVVVCEADRAVLWNRSLLRRFQTLVARLWHEHVLIFFSEEPRKQVWLWAVRLPGGRKLRHREHPFFSDSPPAGFLGRLERLRFSLDEEESVTLLDAVDRVRKAMDVSADLDLFARWPSYAARSDELARAMRSGDPAKFRDFVELHLPLARWVATRWHRGLGLDLEDAEQIAAIGLIQAAERFRPDRGILFSTYAYYWIRQALQRYGPDQVMHIRVPAHVYQECRALQKKFDRLRSSVGDFGITREQLGLELENPKLARYWFCFQRASNVGTLSDRKLPAFQEAARIVDPVNNPADIATRHTSGAALRLAVSRLHNRQARIVRLRFGFDGPPLTLAEVAEREGVTRERVRQIQKKALERLHRWLGPSRSEFGMDGDGDQADANGDLQLSPDLSGTFPDPIRESCG